MTPEYFYVRCYAFHVMAGLGGSKMSGSFGRYKPVLAIGMAAIILTVIFVPMRANAFSLNTQNLSGASISSSSGPFNFSVILNVQAGEHIPVQSIGLLIDGSQVATFDMNANQLTGSPNGVVNLGNPNVPPIGSGGYGEGYGYTYGYGYSYGFGYQYIGGYYSYSTTNPNLNGFTGPLTVTYPATVNPGFLTPGSHTFQYIIYTGLSGSVATTQLYSNPVSFTVTSSSGAGTGTLSVNAQNGNGALNGMAIELHQGFTLLSTKFSPATFTLNAGQSYTVYADDFGSNGVFYTFSGWSTDGVNIIDSNRGHVVSVTNNQNLALIAVYTTSYTPITLSITSITTTGTAITGLFNTVISGDTPIFLAGGGVGNAIGTGFTPDTFNLQPNTEYTAFASDYGRYIFDHWQNSAGQSLPAHFNLRGVAVNSASNVNLVAVYKDIGTANVVDVQSTNIPSIINVPAGGDVRLDITTVPTGPLNLPLSISLNSGGTETVTITISGIVGTGSIIIIPEAVPSSVPGTVSGSIGVFTLGGALTGNTILEIDTSAVALDNQLGTITITIPYNHAAAVASGIPEDTNHIQLFHWTGSAWVPLNSLSINTVQFTITGTITGGSSSPVAIGGAPGSAQQNNNNNNNNSGQQNNNNNNFNVFGGGGGGGGGGGSAIISAPSQANPITVQTDKSSYTSSDTIHVTGAIAKLQQGQAMFISVTNPNGALYRADTITPKSDGTYSYDFKVGGKNGPSGMYTIKVTYAGSSAQTTFQFTAGTAGGMQTYTLNIGGQNYQIQYMITGGSLINMTADQNATSLTANIASTSNGTLTLVLPRNVIDSKDTSGKDMDFNIFADGVAHPNFTEQNSTADSRTLVINFDNGTQKIEVVGTHIVPEFGPVAALVLVIAIIGIIAATRFRKGGNGIGFPTGSGSLS
jgi:hypothetical protein